MEFAQIVEIPFNVDLAVQLETDFQMAKDLEMAELLLFEMQYNVSAKIDPKPKRNRQSAESFKFVDFACVRCGMKIRRTNLPAEAAAALL